MKAVIFLFLLLFNSWTFAKNVCVDTMKDVKAYIDTCSQSYDPNDVLIIFDIDETLLMPTEPAIHGKHRHHYHMRNYVKSLPKDVFRIMLNVSLIQAPSKCVDSDSPDLIKALYKKGFKVMACTASMTGEMDTVKRMEVFRYERLKHNDIVFEKSFPGIPDMTLEDVKGYQGRSPVFYKGILCANGTTAHEPLKGNAIIAFLKAANYTPKLIIFIDDKDYYLEDVKKALAHQMPSVMFKGIQFKGAENQPVDPISEKKFWSYWKNLEKKARFLLLQKR